MFPSRRSALALGAAALTTPILVACRPDTTGRPVKAPGQREPNPALVYRLLEFTHDVCAIEGFSPVQSARVHAYVTLALSNVLLGSRDAIGSDRLESMPRFTGARTAANAVATWRHLMPLLAPGISPAAWGIMRTQQTELTSGQAAASSDALEYAADLAQWSQNDSYLLLRDSQPKVPRGPGRWVPTPPKYRPPVEYFSDRVVPLYLTSPFEARIAPPIPFSISTVSLYHRQARSLFESTAKMGSKEQSIARWWADGPFESASPVGHWMLLAASALQGQRADLTKALETLVELSTFVLDAEIS